MERWESVWQTLHSLSDSSAMIPDEGSIILGQVERTLETQVIQRLPEFEDGPFSKRLQRLIQNGSILSLNQTKQANLDKEKMKYM